MKRSAALMIALVMLCTCAAAESALTVNGRAISVGEAGAWMWLVKQNYSEMLDYYQRTLGIDYWSLSYPNGQSVWDSVKADAFKQLVMIAVFCDMAGEKGLRLSAEETAICEETARACPENEGFTAQDLLAVCRMRVLAGKAYSLMLSFQTIDEEAVTAQVDRSAYVAYEAEYLYVPFYEYGADDAKKQSCMELMARISGFQGSYKEAARLSRRLSAGSMTLCPAESRDDGTLLDAVKGLKPGEVSQIIETDYGLFVLRLISDSDTSLYDAEVEKRLMDARKQAYQAEYKRLYGAAEYSLNADYWDELTP
ncbi:MAG: hypothetical protein II875_12770 [Clostridia bacterium]|nr:hypothetical protein [Clostridia bacterium]